ncbi:hypothetical protein J1N35_011894 [Gossypium stocksii]|uniref:Uncharacterized protein n=1 Tax=Gossypium stocksii TaxID=47602 RepID=A0A9D3W3J3_9ROSI|nr:hypothetical protein J1N35_011894 [Gossypium stocksii]
MACKSVDGKIKIRDTRIPSYMRQVYYHTQGRTVTARVINGWVGSDWVWYRLSFLRLRVDYHYTFPVITSKPSSQPFVHERRIHDGNRRAIHNQLRMKVKKMRGRDRNVYSRVERTMKTRRLEYSLDEE